MTLDPTQPEPTQPQPAQPAPPSGPAEVGWQRLDPRKLLTDPVKLLGQAAIPLIFVLLGVGSGESAFWLLATPALIGIAVLAGAVPWLTTWYRVTETQLQVRTGLLNKKQSTAPLDRVRSVDLEASLLHRVLGLRKVLIGTGVDTERIELDSVSAARAAELRGLLLTKSTVAGVDSGAPAGEPTAIQDPASPWAADASPAENPGREQELARFDLSWVRFAPFSLTRLVLVAGALGFLSQYYEELPFLNEETVNAAWRWVRGFAVALVITVMLLGALLTWVMIAVVGYLVQWWDLRLTREQGSLHLASGLLTTRAISVEEQRVRGIELTEPVLLRLVKGAELATLATGVGEGGSTSILPPCPREVALEVGSLVLEDPTPLGFALRPHGPKARRRAYLRHQWLTLGLAVGAATVTVLQRVLDDPDALGWLPGWLPWVLVAASAGFGVLVARSAYAHLGHALGPRHLVAGSGELTRVRTVLEREGIIGWVLTQSIFQRRVGLGTLIATTAAGDERVVLRDVPHAWAVALAHEATPGTLTPFLAPASP